MSSIGAAIGIAGAVGAAGSVASSAIGANAAESAASTQANAAQKALNFQEQEWNTQQANEAPFLAGGTQGEKELASDLATPGQGLLAQYPGGAFSAPTLAEAEQYPGYQFQLQTGTQALDENAAATGNLMSGTTGEALENYGQGLAQTDYGNLYNQALNTYMTNYGVWNTGQTNTYNRLAGLANTGATAAGQLGAEGQAAATNVGNQENNIGAAEASGTIGAANAITGGISGVTNAASQIPLYQLLAQQGANTSSYGNPAGIPNGNPYGLTGDPFADVPGSSAGAQYADA